MRRWSFTLVSMLGLWACGEAGAGFGDPCFEGADCASGRCENLGGAFGRACTVECDGAGCATGTVCDDGLGYCVSVCRSGDPRGTGEATEVCIDGDYQPCSAQSEVEFCNVCGCEPFGGGTCVAGRGCVVQRADGEACTEDFECSGGKCFVAGTCGSPRTLGEACRVDEECRSGNCSTDGDSSVDGVCNQELGTSCDAAPASIPTCTECLAIDIRGERGVCSRRNCDPTNAPECLRFDGRRWSCVATTSGRHACFENCGFDPSYRCFDNSDYCERGYCQ